jgi:hypothetical protein
MNKVNTPLLLVGSCALVARAANTAARTKQGVASEFIGTVGPDIERKLVDESTHLIGHLANKFI